MNIIFSYTEENGGVFLPPDVPGEPNTWEHLCEVGGRHYAVAFRPLPDQDERIDLKVHDLTTETDVAQIIETFGRPYRLCRQERAEAYPDIGDQLDAILKTFTHLRMNGIDLPQEMDDLLGKWLSVKKENPKPSLVEGE